MTTPLTFKKFLPNFQNEGGGGFKAVLNIVKKTAQLVVADIPNIIHFEIMKKITEWQDRITRPGRHHHSLTPLFYLEADTVLQILV